MTFHNFEGDEDDHDHDDAGEGEDEDVFASCEDAIMKIHISHHNISSNPIYFPHI